MAKVSIIIPVYNRTDTLVRSINSLQAQTYPDFEILIVDDHSTQDVTSPLACYPVRLLKTDGKGVSAARNTGVRASSSEFVAFLDSDDEWMPTKLEKQMEFFNSHPQISIVHTNEIWIREGKTVKQNSKQKKYGGRIFSHCTEQCLIAPSGVLMRRSLLNNVGLFDENFPVCEDFDLWLRIAAAEEIGFLSEALTIKHGGHDDQLSRLYHSMDLWRVRALVKHLGNQKLTMDDHLALRSSIKTKCEILLKGFEKHKNFEHQNEVLIFLDLLNSYLPV